MKIAISSPADKGLASELDPRFGRAQAFLIVESETQEFTVADNSQNLAAAQGAGIQAAQNVADAGVTALITGHCGPKAFRTLNAGGIKIFYSKSETVGQALEELKQGTLKEAASADVEAHW